MFSPHASDPSGPIGVWCTRSEEASPLAQVSFSAQVGTSLRCRPRMRPSALIVTSVLYSVPTPVALRSLTPMTTVTPQLRAACAMRRISGPGSSMAHLHRRSNQGLPSIGVMTQFQYG